MTGIFKSLVSLPVHTVVHGICISPFLGNDKYRVFRSHSNICDTHRYTEQGLKPPIVNGVIATIVSMSMWPAAMLLRGDIQRSREITQQILDIAEDCGHPPTLCSVLASLCNDYLPFLGDLECCETLAARALELADRYNLGHCKHLALRAHQWATVCISMYACIGPESAPVGYGMYPCMHACIYVNVAVPYSIPVTFLCSAHDLHDTCSNVPCQFMACANTPMHGMCKLNTPMYSCAC